MRKLSIPLFTFRMKYATSSHKRKLPVRGGMGAEWARMRKEREGQRRGVVGSPTCGRAESR